MHVQHHVRACEFVLERQSLLIALAAFCTACPFLFSTVCVQLSGDCVQQNEALAAFKSAQAVKDIFSYTL
jgi:hypothetical protein